MVKRRFQSLSDTRNKNQRLGKTHFELRDPIENEGEADLRSFQLHIARGFDDSVTLDNEPIVVPGGLHGVYASDGSDYEDGVGIDARLKAKAKAKTAQAEAEEGLNDLSDTQEESSDDDDEVDKEKTTQGTKITRPLFPVLPKFTELNLDARLTKATVSSLKFTTPTSVQCQVIPALLERSASLPSSQILVQATTGSGKTVTYLLPILHRLLENSDICALILVPTEELVSQVQNVIRSLIKFSKEAVVMGKDIQVATPQVVAGKNFKSKGRMRYIVIDEVDMMTGLGYVGDLKAVFKKFTTANSHCWCFSATAVKGGTSGLTFWSKSIRKNTESMEINERARIKHTYLVVKDEMEKILYLLFALKLHLVNGKMLIFVKNVPQAYFVRTFLQSFGLRVAIMNEELPKLCRIEVVRAFNKKRRQILIATDMAVGDIEDEMKEEEESENEDHLDASDVGETEIAKQHPSVAKSYDASRGIDFHQVQVVVHFDMPKDTVSYKHRSGRTARGGCQGMSLAMIADKDGLKPPPTNMDRWMELRGGDWKIFREIWKECAESGVEPVEQPFPKSSMESFRYRAEDVRKMCTPNYIRQIRLQEIQGEMLRSEKLQSHFSRNPKDLQFLNNGYGARVKQARRSLNAVPEYLVPKALRTDVTKGKKRKTKKQKGWGNGKKAKIRGEDPLSAVPV